jgi:shikimate dehydrogenase
VRNGDTWHGDNTDGVGLVRDLTDRQALDLRARRTLMLGAGGAARGVAPALLDAGIGELYIVNRTPQRTDALADSLPNRGACIRATSRTFPALGEFDLIVNATSAGRDTTCSSCRAPSWAGVAPRWTSTTARPRFPSWHGRARRAATMSSTAWACWSNRPAESFARWHGVRPETDAVYEMLRGHAAVLMTAD